MKDSKSKIIKLTTDNAEIILDSFMKDDVLKKIPVLGNLYTISKAGLDVKNYLLIKKMHAFLIESNKVSKTEKEKFIQKKLDTEDKRETFGEKLLSYIDKIDTTQKSKIMSYYYTEVLYNRITLIEYYDALEKINNFKIHYLDRFIDFSLFFKCNPIEKHIKNHFHNCELINTKEENHSFSYIWKRTEEIKINYESLTNTGLILIKHLIKNDFDLIRKRYINNSLSIKKFKQITTEGLLLEKIRIDDFEIILNSIDINYFNEIKLSDKSTLEYEEDFYKGTYYSTKYEFYVDYYIDVNNVVFLYENTTYNNA
ncbi:hypothetical protein ACXGQW_00890 [Wenyingzhuangia sp. IMCC45533]